MNGIPKRRRVRWWGRARHGNAISQVGEPIRLLAFFVGREAGLSALAGSPAAVFEGGEEKISCGREDCFTQSRLRHHAG